MKTEILMTKDTDYVPPCVEWLETSVEAGFQASATENEGYEIEDGSWDTDL